jgi:hypothetical protein
MTRTIILRFRDLVTEEGGTVTEHQRLLREFGEVWWGWWADQSEVTPKQLFNELQTAIKEQGEFTAYLFDTGRSKFYSTKVSKILVAPKGRIPTPDPEDSPDYYHRAKCPAWFLLKSLEEVDFSKLKFVYDSFPTREDQDEGLQGQVGKQVGSFKDLREKDVTLWVVRLGE